VLLVGLVRRRRNLGRSLTFLDVEIAAASAAQSAALGDAAGRVSTDATPDAVSVGAGAGADLEDGGAGPATTAAPRRQLVCEWRVPKGIVAGLRVRAAGRWEMRGGGGCGVAGDGGGDSCEPTATVRFVVDADGLEVVEDCRGAGAWDNAGANAAFRARVREQGSGRPASPDGAGSAGGGNGGGGGDGLGWGVSGQGGSRGGGGSTPNPDSTSTSAAAMCLLSWGESGRCADPACALRHTAASQWEEHRRRRAEKRQAGEGRGLHPSTFRLDASPFGLHVGWFQWISVDFGDMNGSVVLRSGWV
jgi:hypothetical protein